MEPYALEPANVCDDLVCAWNFWSVFYTVVAVAVAGGCAYWDVVSVGSIATKLTSTPVALVGFGRSWNMYSIQASIEASAIAGVPLSAKSRSVIDVNACQTEIDQSPCQ